MSEQPPPPTAGPSTIRITREFSASRERVWREWTEPERFADWFGGTVSEIPLSSVVMDVRPGGSWRATMYAGPQRHQIQWSGTYQDVVAPERLVFTLTDQPDSDTSALVVVVLTELGEGRTQMLFEQHGGISPQQYRAASDGWQTFFDRIEERLSW